MEKMVNSVKLSTVKLCIIVCAITGFSLIVGYEVSKLRTDTIFALINLLIATVIFAYCLIRNKTIDFFSPQLVFALPFLTIITIGTLCVEQNISLRQWMIYEVGIASFFLGILMAKYVQPMFIGTATYTYSNHKIKVVTALFLLLGITAAIFIYQKAGPPLLQHDVGSARFEVNDMGYIATLKGFIPIASIISGLMLFKGIKEGQKLIKFKLYTCLFLLGILDAIMTGSREALLRFLLILLIAFHYYVKKIKYHTFFIIALFAVIFVGLVKFYRIYSDLGDKIFKELNFHSDIMSLLSVSWHFAKNEFSISMHCLAKLLEVVPKLYNFQYGYLFISPFILCLPGEQLNTGHVAREAIGGDWQGGAAITLVGAFYFDLGFIGVIVGMAFVGFLLKTLHFLAAKNKSLIYILLYAFFLENSLTSIRSNFMNGFIVLFYPISFILFHFLTAVYIRRPNDLQK